MTSNITLPKNYDRKLCVSCSAALAQENHKKCFWKTHDSVINLKSEELLESENTESFTIIPSPQKKKNL